MTKSKSGSITLIFTSLFASSCTDKGSPVQVIDPIGKFVVDSFSPACTVMTNPINDSLWTYVSCILTYHFEVLPGSVTDFGFVVVDYIGMGLNVTPAYPDSLGLIYSWLSSGFWIKDSLSGIDSVTVQCGLNGPFWTLNQQ